MCVLTEKSIPHGDFLLKVASCEQTTATHFVFFISVLLPPLHVLTRVSKCRPVGGFLMIDTGEVDDKIVAVLKDDSVCVSIHRFNTNKISHSCCLVFKQPPLPPHAAAATATSPPSASFLRASSTDSGTTFSRALLPFTQNVFVTFNQVQGPPGQRRAQNQVKPAAFNLHLPNRCFSHTVPSPIVPSNARVAHPSRAKQHPCHVRGC